MEWNKFKSETAEKELKATKEQQSQECQYHRKLRSKEQYGKNQKSVIEEKMDSKDDIKSNEKVLENKNKEWPVRKMKNEEPVIFDRHFGKNLQKYFG